MLRFDVESTDGDQKIPDFITIVKEVTGILKL